MGKINQKQRHISVTDVISFSWVRLINVLSTLEHTSIIFYFQIEETEGTVDPLVSDTTEHAWKGQGHPTDRFREYLFERPIIVHDFLVKV